IPQNLLSDTPDENISSVATESPSLEAREPSEKIPQNLLSDTPDENISSVATKSPSPEAREPNKSSEGMQQLLKSIIPERDMSHWMSFYRKTMLKKKEQENSSEARSTGQSTVSERQYIFPSTVEVSDEKALALFNNWSEKEEL
ncbi:unnamed protein product, partial [Larinioides sclopetarius]